MAEVEHGQIDPEPPEGEAAPEEGEEEEKRPPIWQLFILPLGLVLLVTLMIFAFRIAGYTDKTPAQIVDDARMLTGREFDQAMDELASKIAAIRNNQEDADPDGQLSHKVLAYFDEAIDPRRKSRWALVLGVLKHKAAVPKLIKTVSDSKAEKQLVMFSVMALEQIGDKTAAPSLLPLLDHIEPGVRSKAVHALVKLGGEDYLGEAQRLLSDKQPQDVRCSAALALAMIKDPSGRDQIEFLLDRGQVEAMVGEDKALILRMWSDGSTTGLAEYYMYSAIFAVEHLKLKDEAIRTRLQALADSDSRRVIRQAAEKALRALDED